MIVCVVNEDDVVVVDGEALKFDFTLADNIWAIQWNGTSGHIEYQDINIPNEEITDFSDYQYLIDGHAAEKQRIVDERVQAQEQAQAMREQAQEQVQENNA